MRKKRATPKAKRGRAGGPVDVLHEFSTALDAEAAALSG